MFLRVELIARSWSFFSRKRAQRPMDRKIFALRAPRSSGSAPPDQGTPSRTLIPVTLEAAVADQCEASCEAFTPPGRTVQVRGVRQARADATAYRMSRPG